MTPKPIPDCLLPGLKQQLHPTTALSAVGCPFVVRAPSLRQLRTKLDRLQARMAPRRVRLHTAPVWTPARGWCAVGEIVMLAPLHAGTLN